MTAPHVETLEAMLARFARVERSAASVSKDDYGYRFIARCVKEAEALRAAIALMREREGWVLVPREPTQEMVAAVPGGLLAPVCVAVYKTMIAAAAPTTTGEAQG